MSYRPKKYVYVVIAGHFSATVVNVFATKMAAEICANEFAKEHNIEAWVDRWTIRQAPDQQKEVISYRRGG